MSLFADKRVQIPMYSLTNSLKIHVHSVSFYAVLYAYMHGGIEILSFLSAFIGIKWLLI